MRKKYECLHCEAIITGEKRPSRCLCGMKTFKIFGVVTEDEDLGHEILDGEKEFEYEEQRENTVLEKRLKFIRHVKNKEFGESSELLAQEVQDNIKLYTTKDDIKSEIWVYKEGVYVSQGRSEIKEFLRKFLGVDYSSWHYNQAIVKIEADTFVDPILFFKNDNPEEIPLENGILNVVKNELRDFTEEDIFFNKLPVRYDPEAKCVMIQQFLSDIFPSNEDIKVFYEIGGFCLLKEYKFEKAFMFVGEGRNGKDKSLELLKRVVGINNCCSIPLHSLKADSFQISELFGKMVNLAGDIASNDLRDTSMLKATTGRSLLSGKRKYLSDITFVNYAKQIFACNQLPMVYDLSKGFWDRWILMEFPHTFVTQSEYDEAKDKSFLRIKDPDIIKKITTDEELSGLLNQFLKGLQRVIKMKVFSISRGTEEVKNMWIRKANSFIAFAMDKIEEQSNGRISKKDLRKEYSVYCKKHKVSTKSDIVIKRTLEEMFGSIEGVHNDNLGKYDRIWEGIKWKEN